MKKILPILGCALLLYLGWSYMDEYLYMHPYYDTMLANWKSINVTLLGLIFGLIPTAYILFTKKKNIWVLLASIVVPAMLFALSYISIKGDLYGGGMSLVVHYLFLFALAFFFFIGLENLGDIIKKNFLKLETTTIADILLNLGIGLAVFLLAVYLLVLTNLLFAVLSRLLLVVLGVLLWFNKAAATRKRALVHEALDSIKIPFHHVWYIPFSLPMIGYMIAGLLHGSMTFAGWLLAGIGIALLGSYIMKSVKTRNWGWDRLCSLQGLIGVLTIALLLLTFWYLFHGMQLAYLPYPTAWDANHAYMFYPKMRAFNHGYYWNEPSMSTSMTLWPMYIAFFFSLFSSFKSFLGISPDTIAIQMNFWSGILVLIFGLGLVAELLKFVRGIIAKSHQTIFFGLSFCLGRFLLLQWLLSGMGAFLVFIDNKTDMGVLALIIIAAYSGFIFLNHLQSDIQEDAEKSIVTVPQSIYMYLGISGVLYAIAVLAKPTALFDVVNFGLFLRIIWFGRIGGLGAILFIVGAMTHIDFRGIKNYIPQSLGWVLMVPGALGVGVDVVRATLKNAWQHARYLLGWTGLVVLTIVIVKAPFLLVDTFVYDKQYSPSQFIQKIFLSSSYGATGPQQPLLAQQGTSSVGASCTLASQGFTSADELYITTKKPTGSVYNEDVGRYVGFGWKGNLTTDARRKVLPLLNPWRAKTLTPGCYALNPFARSVAQDAKLICQYEQALEQLETTGLQQLAQQISTESSIGELSVQERIQELVNALSSATPDSVRAEYGPQINDLRSFMQNNTLKIEDRDGVRQVYFPYKFLTPSNITFNWSLQNLSSYYTDIGIVWLLLFVFAFVGLFYGIIIQQRKLIAISLVTIFGRILRWMVGGAILWYAIGIVVRSILAFVAYVRYLFDDDETQMIGIIFLILFFLIGGWQMMLNMVRIGSQGGGGAFLQYKTNHGLVETYNEQLQPSTSISSSFTIEDVFALQFPHYRKFLRLANERAEDQGALIAGTYARYFVEKQHHIKYDQFLTRLWEMFSDGDVCNSYLRLQDQHMKYLVIDPNIGTVVQGAGNQSLFDRFFARVDVSGNTIVEQGTMTMLVELYRAGYIRFVSSNNLGAKYAFILPDATFSGLSGDTLTLARARMALARFFNSTAIINSIVEVAEQRVLDGMFLTDLADLLGVEIRENHLLDLVRQGQLLPTDIADLTNDERKVLGQYLGLRQMAGTNPEQYKQQLQGLVRNSIGGGNQIIVLELVE